MTPEFKRLLRTLTGATVEIRTGGLKSEACFVLLPDGTVGGPHLHFLGWGAVDGKDDKESAVERAAEKYLAAHKTVIQELLRQPAK